MRKLPRVGDRVSVPWGLKRVDGRVLDVYPTGYTPRVLVAVFVDGDEDDPMTVTFPVDRIEPAKAA